MIPKAIRLHKIVQLSLLSAGLAYPVTALPADTSAPSPGAAIFQKLCVECHGASGEGVAGKYDEPLHGSRSLESLARLIERTMPEGKPESCIGDDARAVAEYIYNEFYSVEARQKKGLASQPRVALARLTVPQFRNAVADMLLPFTPAPRSGERRSRRESREENEPPVVEPGLKAEYFQSKGMSKADTRKLERVDPRIDFDFGYGSPAEDITEDQFTIIWAGALLPRHTGEYEFRVRTENGARLYVNLDNTERIGKLRDDSSAAGQAALIDAWVSSGEKREETGKIFLLGGRSYPFRVEFFKYKENTASIKVEWKPPHGSWSVLDERFLTTEAVGRTFVLETPFPADDRSLGYERGSSVTRSWQSAVMNAAAATATEIVNRLPLLAGFNDGDTNRQEQVKEFVVKLARVAFRRPLTEQEEHLYRNILFTDVPNPEAAVRRAMLLMLMSPSFLYTDLTPAGEKPNQHVIATRLSLALWDSIPDPELMKAANAGELASKEQVESQARRMLADSRARAKMRDFFTHWLELEERDLAKDKTLFPGFDEAVIGDLRYSLEAFADEIVWSERSDYRELLLADYLMLNDRLRRLYASAGADPMDEGCAKSLEPLQGHFEPVQMPPGRRSGVLTHPYLLSAFAYPNNTSPIHRGVFLTRNIIGRPLKPPPVAVAFNDAEFTPTSTMREKITQLTRDKACMSCHSVINPLGFALENFDAVGRWRSMDNNRPVDTKGSFVTDEGNTVELASALDVAKFAVGSLPAHRAFVTEVFHHLIKEDPIAFGPSVAEALRKEFEADGFNIKNLMVRIAVLAAGHGGKTIQITKLDP